MIFELDCRPRRPLHERETTPQRGHSERGAPVERVCGREDAVAVVDVVHAAGVVAN